ncbi:16S rRNA C1402 N4-methylase RsmH [Desulfohalotomaculum tongense]|uniref:tRNA (mnm(5)s(2)U34)-methyltransferase n=1 Tax=Desulforadius tongensis TaxID=1216062 RepID=UPI001EE609E6|nr:class I SAM-dependent methyltransferase [Desulforadius tongensis]MBM7855503.1 16S rRNA C1402 N4-methylase RsmH [Desulforadius tongensis]
MFRQQRSAVAMAHQFIASNLPVDGTAIDATAGNGNDTVFLAQHLKKGRVFAFDIQKQALDNTADLLKQQGIMDRVKLIHDGHQNIDNYVQEPVDAVMFNLGYLPGGDHCIITKPDSTVEALQKAVRLLKVGGKISLVVYTGHEGGLEEFNAVEAAIKELDSRNYWVVGVRFVNRPAAAPVSFFIERVG